MANTEPLPNRQWELIIGSIVFLVLGTIFTIWRLIERSKVTKWMSPSDWLMMLGVIVNDVDCVLDILAGFAGAGRLRRDPLLSLIQKVQLQKFLFVGQMLNIYAMFLIKLSICAYLLALNFSKTYRHLMWGTLVFVVIFNFILPSISLWGLCSPLAARWDPRIENKVCWPITVRIAFGYMQSVSNIITDVIYATAPIVYLRKVQLRKRTQRGVRAVFIMSLVCTTVSALKIWDQERHKKTKEIVWDLVSMTLWATAENTVGVVVANLPPLRKPFERLFRSLVVSTGAGDTYAGDKTHGETSNNFRMQSYRTQGRRKSMMESMGRIAGLPSTGDGESDEAVLVDLDRDNRKYGLSTGIMKTTEVTVLGSEKDGRDDIVRR